MSSLRYNPSLDGLRTIAVMMVIAYHSSVPYSGYGYLGVDVFFVLSGFLITGILVGEADAGGIRLGAFYLRRVRRLYPALVVLVAAMLAIGWATWGDAAKVLLYLSDYLPPASMGHAWSLAVEEHYYLLWPLVVPFLARMKRERAVLVLFVAWLVCHAWAAWCATNLPWNASFRFDTRVSGLVFGSMLALMPRESMKPFWLMLGVYVVTALSGTTNHRALTETMTATVILLTYTRQMPFLDRPTFVYLGKISYGLYLFHPAWEWFARQHFDENPEIFLATALPSIACAALSYHTVEAWFRKPRTTRSIPQPSSQSPYSQAPQPTDR